jgi:threonine dehydrogenase-like Zn-dependent dehydrogenase
VRALRLHDTRDLRLHDEPAPGPGDGEVVVRVTAVGLCSEWRDAFDDLVERRGLEVVVEPQQAGG